MPPQRDAPRARLMKRQYIYITTTTRIFSALSGISGCMIRGGRPACHCVRHLCVRKSRPINLCVVSRAVELKILIGEAPCYNTRATCPQPCLPTRTRRVRDDFIYQTQASDGFRCIRNKAVRGPRYFTQNTRGRGRATRERALKVRCARACSFVKINRIMRTLLLGGGTLLKETTLLGVGV